MSDNNNDFEYKQILNDYKMMLADYQEFGINPDDLTGTKNFNPEYYSDEVKLYRSQEDSLVYLFDHEDETTGQVELDDLKIILQNISERITKQRRQAYELEKFLSE